VIALSYPTTCATTATADLPLEIFFPPSAHRAVISSSASYKNVRAISYCTTSRRCIGCAGKANSMISKFEETTEGQREGDRTESPPHTENSAQTHATARRPATGARLWLLS
jgi:hypothetical protein